MPKIEGANGAVSDVRLCHCVSTLDNAIARGKRHDQVAHIDLYYSRRRVRSKTACYVCFMRDVRTIAACAALVSCGGIVDDPSATGGTRAAVIGTEEQSDAGRVLASSYGAAARCEDAPLVPVGGTVVVDTCGGTTISAAICWSSQPRKFFRVDAPPGVRLRFHGRSDVGMPHVTVWQDCSNNVPRECAFPAVASFAARTLTDARLFGVELFDTQGYPIPPGEKGCGTVSVNVTTDTSKP